MTFTVFGAGGLDYKTPLRVHHAGTEFRSITYSLTSDISLTYAVAGINLVGFLWPFVFTLAWLVNQKSKNSVARRIWLHYAAEVKSLSNRYRWLEFIICMPMAIMVAAITMGANDFFLILTHMLLSAATIVIAYCQEREVKASKKDQWLPLCSACGLSICQYTLILWQGVVSLPKMQVNSAAACMPVVTLMIGSCAVFAMQISNSKYKSMFRITAINDINYRDRENIFITISLVGKLIFSSAVFWFISSS